MEAIKPILFVDDSPRDTLLALEALTQCSMKNHVVTVSDGFAALDYLHYRGEFTGRQGQNPSVILLDLKMPKLDGLEVLTQIKSDANLMVIPVVMMTSSQEESDVLLSYQLGANAYMVKPVKFDDFVNAVKQLSTFWTRLNVPPPDTIQSVS